MSPLVLIFLALFVGLITIILRPVIRYQITKRKLDHIPQFHECGTSVPVLLAGGPNGLQSVVKSLVKPEGGFEPIIRWGPSFNGKCCVLVTHPDGVRDILVKDDIFAKDDGYDILAEYLGDSVVTSSGAVWKAKRRLLTPVFHFTPLKRMIPAFVDEAQTMLETIKKANGEPIDVCDLFSDTTLAVIIRTGFGSEFDVPYMAHQWHTINQELARVMIPHMLFGKIATHLPTSWKFKQAVKNVEKKCEEAIKRRRQESNFESPDLLSLMLKAERDGVVSDISDTDMIGECIIFLFAGQDTTASTMDWCAYYLGLPENKDIQDKLRAEVDEVLGKDVPTDALLSKLNYTKMVIEESLRIRGPAMMLSRTTTADTELLGYKIPMGTPIRVGVGITSLNSEEFENPEKFNPERFRDKTNRHPFSYVPFSAGNRNCIGQKFAIQEALVLLSLLVQNYEIRVEPDAPFVTKMAATLMPMGLKARFIPRAK